MGSVGKFLAHSLSGSYNSPPITLCYHRPSFLTGLQQRKCNLTVSVNNVPEERGPFDVELVLPARRHPSIPPQHPDEQYSLHEYYAHLMSNEPIDNLIVTTKAHQTVSALASVMHRLKPSSTICFIQNGMGVVEEVNKHLYADPADRPHYMLGVSSHGTQAAGPFEATHAGHGIIYLTILPQERSARNNHSSPQETPPQQASLFESESDTDALSTSTSTPQAPPHIDHTPRYLLRALCRIPVLAAVPLAPSDFHTTQLEKLAVNCVINPLTVLLDCRNGSLLNNFPISRSMRLLLSEISLVYQSLPELRDTPGLDIKFSPARLEAFVTNIARSTHENISSMLQDTRRGTKTEIDYMNGYIVRRGEETGIKPAMNYLMMQVVKGKQSMIVRELSNYVPVSGFEGQADFERGGGR